MRPSLAFPALVGTSPHHTHDPNVRAYYRHLIANRGLKKLQAVCAVTRKLLLAIHAMVSVGVWKRLLSKGVRFLSMA